MLTKIVLGTPSRCVMAQVTEHPGDLWEALASGANRASFLLFFVSLNLSISVFDGLSMTDSVELNPTLQ